MLEQKLDSLGTSMVELGHLIGNMPFEELITAIEALTAQLATAAPAAPKPATKIPARNVDPVAAAEPADAKPAEAEPADAMTMEEMTRAALALSRDGKGNAVREKLSELSASRISLLDADRFGEFQKFLKEMGQ